MTGKTGDQRSVDILRRQAEEILGQRDDQQELADSRQELPRDIQSVLHELRVHQVELEIQNEELRDSQLVTEAAKQKAEEVRDQFMRLFHEAPVGYAAVDQGGMIHAANQTLREMTGLKADLPLGRTAFATLLHPADEPVFRARFPAFFDQPDGKRLEMRLRHSDDEDFWVELSGRTVSWRSARPSSIYPESQLLVSINDIRERKKLEVELGLAAQVFEHSAEGIVITDAEGRILRVNNIFTVVTGYRQEEVVGKTTQIFKSGRHPEEFYRRMWETITTEGRWQGEIWKKRKNGEIYREWLHIAAVYDKFGKITNFISILSDISEQKQS